MGQNLIDKLVTVCGSPSRAAGELGVSRSMMSQLMDGSKQLSPEAAALAAHIVGSDPYREAAEAMVKNCKDARKAERLTQAFHLPRSIGGAAMLLIFVIGGLFGTADASAKCINPGLTVYTLWQLLRRARTRAKDWKRAGFRLSGNAFRASRHYLRPQTLEHLEPGFCLDGARSRYRTL